MFYGYYSNLPSEEPNPWYGPDCPDDETIERISKDEEERRQESA